VTNGKRVWQCDASCQRIIQIPVGTSVWSRYWGSKLRPTVRSPSFMVSHIPIYQTICTILHVADISGDNWETCSYSFVVRRLIGGHKGHQERVSAHHHITTTTIFLVALSSDPACSLLMAHRFVSNKEVFAILVLIALVLSSYNSFTFWSTQQSSISPEGTHTYPINDASEFRRLLSAVNPLDALPHSKTLGVASRLYVLGLPGRDDRREVMERLQTAMGKLNFS
jgi:hypothetical protein